MSSLAPISLQHYAAESEFSSFLVIEAEHIQEAHLDLFTPYFMKWSPSVWIFDLKSCKTYWNEKAKAEGVRLHELFKEYIENHFVQKDCSYRAFLGPHPWPGLLLIKAMQTRNLTGLLLWQAPFTQSLYRSLSWKLWFQEVAGLAECYTKKAKEQNFKSRLRLFERAISRLTVKEPWELREMMAPSLQRRYGSLVAKAWEWTYPRPPAEPRASQLSLFALEETHPHDLKDFPWVRYQLPDPPQIERLLEYPVADWPQVAEALREDLDKLLKHPQFSKNWQVCELRWRITLSSFKDIDLPIGFYKPHSLHDEAGEHKTALQQFHFAYEKAVTSIKLREEDLDLPLQIPFISWEIGVSRKISASEQNYSLLDCLAKTPFSQIQSFSNKLPAPLLNYCLHPNFCPERSFSLQTAIAPEGLEEWESLKYSAKKRPLFIFKVAAKLIHQAASGPKYFLERSSENWWEQGDTRSYFRDYFLVQDHQRRCLWAYRNSKGQWFQHGLYS